ncbi:DNA mismatch repair endonuclease MutL [Sporolactobacillus spathodeae]|uniref:DNA mismatch repair protein MutL n=1 Tax=Sporolactobacillus spathodeae TaxID=1465502 RepID=A0ABS2Q5H8_9BACL|nr:DNA mismatch repair endonuclease MutL [Sporolactobacillus spathodeae]MBM7657033.1 DNA mismatch repair protein MutL [Sporolactobacillus spathodeae]
MGEIKRLSESLANKIAAGEVVERPASVVKELVENAIDAEAMRITIDIEEGGMKKIKVTDDGKGFAPEDCAIAFERHATSKIRDDSDLFHIQTLGFRGEALPSIAAVSYLELKTSDGDHPGTHLVFQAGHIIQSGHTESRRGTEITVSKLFYNTPARLKYLKSIHTELGKITDVINRMALSYPGIRFTLTHDGKQIFMTNGSGELSHVLAAVYGIRTAKSALPFYGDSLDFHIEGVAVHPQISRAGRQYVYIIINKRFIINYPIFNAIMAGYHTLLMIGRYPICVLHIHMDPSLIDVNVHPSKLEARISKEKELCALICDTLQKTFHKEQLIPLVSTRDHENHPEASEQQAMNFSERVVIGPDVGGASVADKSLTSPEPASPVAPTSEEIHEQPAAGFDEVASANIETASTIDASGPIDEVEPGETLESIQPSTRRIPRLWPIGQMHGTYIFAQNEDGLYIIDQHAAQERINYEYYREKVGQTAQDVQELLIPMTFEFNAAEYATIMAYHDYLQSIGLDFEPFGDHTLVIHAHPTWMPKGREQQMIEDIVDELLENGRVSIKKMREKLAIMMSCKRAIKANHYLRNEEIQSLLDTLAKAQDPFSCPHGRPVIVHFSGYEMEKMFKRVQ